MVYDAGGPATTSLFVHGKMWLPLRVQEEKESKKNTKRNKIKKSKGEITRKTEGCNKHCVTFYINLGIGCYSQTCSPF